MVYPKCMKSLYLKWLPTALSFALVVVAADDYRLYRDVQEYRAIGTMLTEEPKPAEFFLNQYHERVREQNEKFQDEHAMMCLGIAAHMGCDDAQGLLGNHLDNRAFAGEGKRFDAAHLEWKKKAAEQGRAKHQYAYASSIGFPIEPWENDLSEKERADRLAKVKEAFTIYLKAAEQGHLEAQSKLASYYRHGYGCEKNLDEALRWALKAHEMQLKERNGASYETRYVGELYLEMGKPEEALSYLEYCAMYGDIRAEKLWREADRLMQQQQNEHPKP